MDSRERDERAKNGRSERGEKISGRKNMKKKKKTHGKKNDPDNLNPVQKYDSSDDSEYDSDISNNQAWDAEGSEDDDEFEDDKF